MLIKLKTKVVLWLVVVCLIWGSTWLVIKIGLATVPPFLAAGLRFMLASILLYAMMVMRKESLPRGTVFQKLALFIGLTAFGVPYALVYWGQRLIPSALASILFASYPFFVALFSHFLLQNEKMNGLKVVGVLLGFAGVYVIFSNELSFDSHVALAGMAAIVASAFIQAFSLVYLKKHGEAFSPIGVNFAAMSLGTILLLVTSVLVEDYSGVSFTGQALLSIVYLAVLGNVTAFVAYFWLVKHVDTVLLSMTSFVTPIIAVALGAFVLGESLAPRIFSGATLVLCGILAANGKELARMIASKKALLWD
ncbi:MAG TPA: EamA family transporter [Bacteroidota bacterium]